MGRFKKHLRNARKGLLALALLVLVPAAVEAAGFGFRNDTQIPIYVQGSCTVNGQIQRGPLLYIKPGQTAWDVNLKNSTRTITIYDASNQKLFQDTLPFLGKDIFYSVVTVAVPRGQPPRVDLRLTQPPPGKDTQKKK